jgi:hypothetical protein
VGGRLLTREGQSRREQRLLVVACVYRSRLYRTDSEGGEEESERPADFPFPPFSTTTASPPHPKTLQLSHCTRGALSILPVRLQ